MGVLNESIEWKDKTGQHCRHQQKDVPNNSKEYFQRYKSVKMEREVVKSVKN